MQSSSRNIDQELFYYEKLKEIKYKKIKSPDFKNQKNFLANNYGAQLINQQSITQFDGANAATSEEEIPEEMPDVISEDEQGQNYAAFNRLKQDALEKVKKSKAGIERTEKIAKAAKTLKQVKNIKNLANLVKAFCGITLWGLIVTYLVMLVQFIGGNIFKSKYIPPLGMIEQLIFIPVFIINVICQMVCLLVPLAAVGILGEILGAVGGALDFVGIL